MSPVSPCEVIFFTSNFLSYHYDVTALFSWFNDITRHLVDPCSALPRLQVVLRCAGDELERRYRGELAAHVSVLLLCDGGGAERRRGLMAVTEELFRDGVNWGRIVAMMELGGALCTEVVQRGGGWQVDDIAGWMEESLESPPLREWIEDNGGWVGGRFLSSFLVFNLSQNTDSVLPSLFPCFFPLFLVSFLVSLFLSLVPSFFPCFLPCVRLSFLISFFLSSSFSQSQMSSLSRSHRPDCIKFSVEGSWWFHWSLKSTFQSSTVFKGS